MQLFSRLRIRLVLIALLPITAFLGYDTIRQSKIAERQTLQQAADISYFAIDIQRRALDSVELVSRLISQIPAVRLLAPNACNATLAGIVKSNPRYASLAVQDRAGNVLCSSAPLTGPVNVADRSYFQRAMATKSFAVGDYQLGRLTGKPSLGTALPILDDSGAVTRLIYAGLDMIWFSERVATVGLPEGSAFLLVDRKGVIMARWPDPQAWVGRDISGEPLFRAIGEHGANASFSSVGVDGVERIYHSFDLKPSEDLEPLLAAVGIPAAIARAAAREDLTKNLIIALGIGLALVTAAVWFAERTISHPIRALTALVRRFGTGDFDARADIARASDEVRLLATTFEDMARSLKGHQERLLGQQELLSTIGTVSRRYDPDGSTTPEHLTRLKDVSGVLGLQLPEAEHRTDGRRADIIEVTADGVVIADEALTILRFNPAAEKLFGYTAAEVVGRNIDILLPARARDAHPAQVEAFSRSPVTARLMGQRGEVAGRRKDGTEFPAEASIAKLPANGGWVFVNVMSDITERKAAERTLEKSETRLRHLIDTTGVVPYILDVSAGRYLYIAPQVTKLLGYPAEDWRDENFWLDRVRPEDRDPVIERWSSFKARHGDDVSEYRMVAADGRTVWLRDSMRLEREAGGSLVGYGLMLDITESKQRDQQLFQAQKMETVGQLTGGISHDFNNLLAVVIGNVDLLAPRVERDPEARALVESILKAGLRGAELNRGLLAFSRRQSLQPRPVNVNDLISEGIAIFRHTLGEQVEVIFVPAADLWRSLIDPAQLESALLNLAVNARDAMPKGGTLTIETDNTHLDQQYADRNAEVTPGDYVAIAVSDTGTGMSPEVAAQAFEPFFTTKKVGRGTGLGLSMTHGFVKQSGGHIKIYSEEGHGTTIRMFLPRCEAELAMAAPAALADREHQARGRIILVVEDQAEVRSMVLKQLAELGYTTVEATDGPSALAIIATDQPMDLLFTDIVMPGGMTGPELSEQARKFRPELKTLFTTGFAAASLENGNRKLFQAGHLLTKPYRKQDLANKLHEIFS